MLKIHILTDSDRKCTCGAIASIVKECIADLCRPGREAFTGLMGLNLPRCHARVIDSSRFYPGDLQGCVSKGQLVGYWLGTAYHHWWCVISESGY